MCIPISKPLYPIPQPRIFPKGLIYKVPETNSYRLANNAGKVVGEMSLLKRICNNSAFYKNIEANGTTLHIYNLDIEKEEWGKGWGTYLLDFAKKESYKRGCKGRCSLVAHYPGRPPHVFYKKNGFITPREDINQLLDKCIENGVYPNFLSAIDMFIPIKEFMINKDLPQKPKKGTFKTIIEYLKNIF